MTALPHCGSRKKKLNYPTLWDSKISQIATLCPHPSPTRLQAVPFWIVERSREIAEREKKTRANERKGAWGEAGKRGKEKKGTALLAVTDAFRVTPPAIH